MKKYLYIFLLGLPFATSIPTFIGTYKISPKVNFTYKFNEITKNAIENISPLELSYFYTYYDGLNISLSQMIESNVETIIGHDNFNDLKFKYYYGEIKNDDDFVYADEINFDNFERAQNLLNFTVKISSPVYQLNKIIYFDFRPMMPSDQIIIDKKLQNKSIKEQFKWFTTNDITLRYINNYFKERGIKTANGIKKNENDSDIIFGLNNDAINFISNNGVIKDNLFNSEIFNEMPPEWHSSFFNVKNDFKIVYKDINDITSKELKNMDWDWGNFNISKNTTLKQLDKIINDEYAVKFKNYFNLENIPKLESVYRITAEGLHIYESPIVNENDYEEIIISEIPDNTLWIEFKFIDDISINFVKDPGLHVTFNYDEGEQR